MREMGNWREYFTAQLAEDREAAIDYLKLTFEEYQVDNDLPFFLKGIRTFLESQGGVSELSKRTGVAPETLLEVLSCENAPRLDMLSIILKGLECRLSVESCAVVNVSLETEHSDPIVAHREDVSPNLEIATEPQ